MFLPGAWKEALADRGAQGHLVEAKDDTGCASLCPQVEPACDTEAEGTAKILTQKKEKIASHSLNSGVSPLPSALETPTKEAKGLLLLNHKPWLPHPWPLKLLTPQWEGWTVEVQFHMCGAPPSHTARCLLKSLQDSSAKSSVHQSRLIKSPKMQPY